MWLRETTLRLSKVELNQFGGKNLLTTFKYVGSKVDFAGKKQASLFCSFFILEIIMLTISNSFVTF